MNEMPQKNDDRLAIRLPGELLETLAEIQTRHGLTPTEIARRCLEQVAAFYRKNRYFSFPVHILPDAEFVRNVTEGPAPGATGYGSGPHKTAQKPDKESAASQTSPKKKSA